MSLRDFREKVVVVTGAAGGLGRALCVRFGAAGSRIVAMDRDASALAGLLADLQAKGITAITEVCDLSREDDCHRGMAAAIQVSAASTCWLTTQASPTAVPLRAPGPK
jgi:NAD(P)-dependent dehydrogenase (short-subunit alcohol dehydrogenase family)